MARQPVNMQLGGPEQLRTTARPLGSNVAVAQVGQSRGAALAGALASIQPGLASYLQEVGAEFRESEEARAYDAIQGMTFEQAKELVAKGDMRATESPWYKAAFDKQFGLAYAGQRRREIVDAYQNSFDKHNGDVDAFLADYAANDAEQYGDNKHIMSGLREGMSGVFKTVKDSHAEWQSETTRATASDRFIDVARNAYDRATEAGQNPMEAIGALYGSHREMLGLTYAEMDDQVFQIAQELADAGDVQGAKAILEYDRVGDDGMPVGSFTGRAKYSLKARALLDTAQANQGQNLRASTTPSMVGLRERAAQGRLNDQDRQNLQGLQDTQAISPEMHESLLLQDSAAQAQGAAKAFDENQKGALIGTTTDLLRQGRGYTLQDAEVQNPITGTVKSYTAAELLEEAATDEVNRMLAANASPSVVAQHMAEWGVNFTYAPFENAMSYGYQSLTEAVASAGKDGPKIAEPAIAGYQTWKAMSNQPRLRDAHIVDATAGQIYRDAHALERVGVPIEDALLRSASIDRKAGRNSLSSTVDRNRFESTVRRAVGTGWFSANAINGSQVASWVEESVRVQMDLGVSMSEAVKNGLQAYKDSHEVINGVAINVRDNFIPPNFAQISSSVLSSFAAEAGVDAGELTLYPSHEGSDFWLVVYKGNLMPVAAEGFTGRFHISQLQQSALGTNTREGVNAEIAGRPAAQAERRNYLSRRDGGGN